MFMFGNRYRDFEARLDSLRLKAKDVEGRYMDKLSSLESRVYRLEESRVIEVDSVDAEGEFGPKVRVDLRDVVREIAVDLNRELTYRKAENGHVVLREL